MSNFNPSLLLHICIPLFMADRSCGGKVLPHFFPPPPPPLSKYVEVKLNPIRLKAHPRVSSSPPFFPLLWSQWELAGLSGCCVRSRLQFEKAGYPFTGRGPREDTPQTPCFLFPNPQVNNGSPRHWHQLNRSRQPRLFLHYSVVCWQGDEPKCRSGANS